VAAQFDVSFNPSVVNLTGVSAGDTLAGHVVDQRQLAPGHWRVLAYSTTNGPIAPGAMVWLSFNIPTNSPDGIVPLGVTDAIIAQIEGQRMQPLAQVNGALTVGAGSFMSMTLEDGGKLRTTIVGIPGRVFTLQGTPDLFHWADLRSYTNLSGTLVLTNIPPDGRDAYFYRTVFRPGTNAPAGLAPSLSDTRLLSDGRVRFQLNSAGGSVWRVEGSPDLVHWGNYGTVTNPAGTLLITNSPVMRPRVYFFRMVQP